MRSSGAAPEVLALLGLFLPVVYAGAWAVASLARRTPLSLALTGREWRGRRAGRARRGKKGQPGKPLELAEA